MEKEILRVIPKKTPKDFPKDKHGVPRDSYGQNALSTGRKSKTRKK